jgi:acyl-homoserine-lactone acylase
VTLVACCAAGIAAAAAAGDGGEAHGAERARWRGHSAAVEIIRDSWGIAHVYGTTDADAVFGAVYAQAEDDFARIERNYLAALGWLAQAEGESALYADLRQRLFVDPARLRRAYAGSPRWLQSLMVAWADGLNCYLAAHPHTHAKVIHRFEPWMALAFTEGSIGGDIETIDLGKLQEFYGHGAPPAPAATARLALPAGGAGPAAVGTAAAAGAASPGAAAPHAATPGALAPGAATPGALAPGAAAPGGSNGFAIAPARTASGHALLWINPHTTFYFRSELQMVSDQGLDVYGAVTWGQFFVYQGFNAHNGWMHTSYGGDAIDEYAERIVAAHGRLRYRYGAGLRPVDSRVIVVPFKQGERQATRRFTVYRTHHGPLVRADGGRWIAVKLLNDPVPALEQSFLRTKTTDYRGFRATQELRTDTSNNTVYADADGTIAYFHGNFVPRRDPRYDFTHPVDGADPATEWHGAHRLEETITLENPATGWIQNTNNWPFSAAGEASPRPDRYPAYMWTKGENPRGRHAVQLLHDARGLTLDGLIALAYDSRLNAFDELLPPLLRAYDDLPAQDPRRQRLGGPVEALRGWDRRTAAGSIPTAIAIFWGEKLIDAVGPLARAADEPVYDFLVGQVNDAQRLAALEAAVTALQADFGSWQTPWGDVNRFQRITDDIVQPFDDSKPSLPVGFAPSQWGALASFDAARPRSTKKIYGSVGNSFVAAVEFGPSVRAKAIMSGGASGDPASPHFTDQAQMFTRGIFRDVLFTREETLAHAERRYRPEIGPPVE